MVLGSLSGVIFSEFAVHGLSVVLTMRDIFEHAIENTERTQEGGFDLKSPIDTLALTRLIRMLSRIDALRLS